MKKTIFGILTLFLSLNNIAISQVKSFHSIEQVTDYNVEELKSHFKHYDNIFISTSLDSTIQLPQHVFKIENSINPKFLNKGDQDFLVYVFIHSQSNHLIVDISNARLIKQSNKKLRLIYYYSISFNFRISLCCSNGFMTKHLLTSS